MGIFVTHAERLRGECMLEEDPVINIPQPVFQRCEIIWPDGRAVQEYEMFIGGTSFGRGSKEVLLSYLERIRGPLPSGHWKERRNATFKKFQKGKKGKLSVDAS
jgi:hypothetical protein